MKKELRIIDYAWHQAHLYRLATSLPAEFTIINIRKHKWNAHQRPIPDNVRFIEWDDFRPSDYDLALLHLDQWCDSLPDRAYPFRRMESLTRGMPRLCIMHGTPDDIRNRTRILRILGDVPMLCNSVAAATQWKGEDALDVRAVIHGYNPARWRSGSLRKRQTNVITISSGGQMSSIYHGIPLLHRMVRDVPIEFYGPMGNREWLETFDDYRQMLSEALVYFSPTRAAPMPGARTEAMLSGCCVVSTPGNDWDSFVVHGETGYIVGDYRETIDLLRDLVANPRVAYKVGQTGRRSAAVLFNHKRFAAEWLAMLSSLGINRAIDLITPEMTDASVKANLELKRIKEANEQEREL